MAILGRYVTMVEFWKREYLPELDAHLGRAYVLRGGANQRLGIPKLIQPFDRDVRWKT
jgi:hypothetical protein